MSEALNVLFITADQWRGECLSRLAHPCVKTPHLDRLAEDGVTFRRHFAQATPCGPSRASLLTGTYLMNNRAVVNGTPLDSRHRNVAREVRKAGYDPTVFGYTDIGADPRDYPADHPALTTYEGLLPGMAEGIYLGDNNLPWIEELRAKGYDIADGEVFRPRADVPGAAERGPTYAPARYKSEDSNAAFLTDAALDHIAGSGGKPWFVHMSYLAPHPPFIVPEPFHDLYDPGEVPALVRAASPEEEGAQHPYLSHYLFHQTGSGISLGYKASEHNLRFTEAEILQARATYFAMMTQVDEQVGRLVEVLKASGAYDRTLIVFTSDHGEQLGDHWQFAKYGYFEQTFWIPLIVRDPRAAADGARGEIVEAFTENVDVMPTILDALDLEVPVTCDGESLVPFCQGQQPSVWRDAAFSECDFRNMIPKGEKALLGQAPDQCCFNVLRDRRYKYVHFTNLPPLLFDLQEDPGEFRNLATDPAYQGLMLDYAQRLLSHRMNHAERNLANVRLTPKGAVETRPPRRYAPS